MPVRIFGIYSDANIKGLFGLNASHNQALRTNAAKSTAPGEGIRYALSKS